MSPFDAAERHTWTELPVSAALGTPILDGQTKCEPHRRAAVENPIESGHSEGAIPLSNAAFDPIADQPPPASQSNSVGEPHSTSPLPMRVPPPNREVEPIIALWRQRQDLKRAYQRLDLQCQSVCRRFCDGDTAKAAKLWAAIKRGGGEDHVAMILLPYMGAMEPLDRAAHGLELRLTKLVRPLPLWTGWALGVRGLGELSLAAIIGEANATPADYRTVSGLWKRMGLAVINGERQRRVAGDGALLQGYSPQRRAVSYVIATNMIRAQGTDGPYRAIYDRRKAYELERGIPKAHAHNRALRYMVKALLKDCWLADRRLGGREPGPPPESGTPPTSGSPVGASWSGHASPRSHQSRPATSEDAGEVARPILASGDHDTPSTAAP